MTEREQELEREVARLRQTVSALCRYNAPPERSIVGCSTRWWLGLDEYELVNLREALRAIGSGTSRSPLDVLNSGDWVYQILNRLETVKPLIVPNRSAESYREEALRQATP